MGYLEDDVTKGDQEQAGAVEQECLPPAPLPPPPQSTPPPQLLPPAKEAKQLPLEQIEIRGSQQKAKRGGNILELVDIVSACGDGAKGKEGQVAFWDKNDGIEHQWWNELVLVHSLVERLEQEQRQPQLPDVTAPTPWPSPQAPLPQQQSVKAQRQPNNQQQRELSGAATPDPWPPPMSADLDESNSEREIGRPCFLVFVLGGQSNREQDESDWKREGIDTGWSFSIFGGWGHETPGRRLTRPRRTRVRGKR